MRAAHTRWEGPKLEGDAFFLLSLQPVHEEAQEFMAVLLLLPLHITPSYGPTIQHSYHLHGRQNSEIFVM